MPGGLMRSNIPSFRLPAEVLDEEIDMIVDMGADLRLGTPVKSMKALLAEKYDAVFVGSGAPKGKNLKLPGRDEASERIHIGIQWLESVAFGHIEKIGEKVLIIGVGNTAMDCCRTSLRLGAKSVKVMARKPREFFKASPWELEDAEEETVEIVVNHSPKSFVVKNGKLTGMIFEKMEYEFDARGRITGEKIMGEEIFPCDDVVLAIGQENAFPWIERDLGIEFDKWEVPVVDAMTYQGTRPGVFFGGDAAFGPEEHHLGGRARPPGRDLHPQALPGRERRGPPAVRHEPRDLEDGHARVVVQQRLRSRRTAADAPREAQRAVQEAQCRGGARLHARAVHEGSRALPQLRHPDRVHREALHRVRCLRGHLPDPLPDHNRRTARKKTCARRLSAPAQNLTQDLYVSDVLPQTGRVMVKDEDLCVHCGLCAERCPTGAWDMQKFTLTVPYADGRGRPARCPGPDGTGTVNLHR